MIGQVTNMTRSMTGARGRLEGMYGESRSADCSVHVRVRYWDPHRCDDDDSRMFVIRETRRSSVRFTRSVTLQNGQSVDLDLGQFPNQDLRFTLFHELPAAHWQQSDEIDIGTACVDLFDDADGSDDADEIKGSSARYDASTGTRGRIATVWGNKRAGTQSGLTTIDAVSGTERPVASGDVIVKVAFNHRPGAPPKRFLIQETRRSNVKFSKAVTLQDGEEKWLNLGQFPN